jgi:hypothetical protein
MMVAISASSRTGLSFIGAVLAMRSSHCGAPATAFFGASGCTMHGMPAGTPAFMPSQPSSLPTNSSLLSLCSRIWRMVSAASVGYSGTEMWPASQMAQSVIIQCAVFFEISAMWLFGGRFRLLMCAAIRRVSSIACCHVHVRTWPPLDAPSYGCVKSSLLGVVFSQWYRRCRASVSAAVGVLMAWCLRRNSFRASAGA